MKKTITLLTILLLVIFMVGCENSVNPTNSDIPITSMSQTDNTGTSLAKKAENGENNRERNNDKVEICHMTGNGKYVTISVDESAVQAHLDHGDRLAKLTGEWDIIYTSLVHTYNFNDGEGTWDGSKGGYEIVQKNYFGCDEKEFELEIELFGANNVSFLLLKATGYFVGENTIEGKWWEWKDGEWKPRATDVPTGDEYAYWGGTRL